ncbi:MAG: hypothetical protein K5787_10880 [Lentisphaeria bacterium]|nr:hypothetical protein [Victivallales bacterium]MCR4574259.1 hypothetical protein [Lentisphaeria bacterium]
MNKLIVLLCLVGMFATAQTTTRRWVDTNVYSGTGTVQTGPFRLWDTKWRIVYKPSGSSPFEIYLLNLSTQERQKVTKQKNGKLKSGQMGGSGNMAAASLVIDGGENGWRVTVQQYLDRIEEWEYLKQKDIEKRLNPFGGWSGEEGDHEYTFEMPAGCARLTAHQKEDGYLRVDIIDPEGNTVVRSISSTKGKQETWFYEKRQYQVKVSAVKTNWALTIETLDDFKLEERR